MRQVWATCVAAALAAAATPTVCHAAAPSTASALASATIVEPAGISVGSGLRLAASPGRRNIISTDPGAYAVLGGPGQSFSVEAPAQITLTAADGSSAVRVDITSRKTLRQGPLGVSAGVEIMASAALPAGATAGRYSGSYETTASYE